MFAALVIFSVTAVEGFIFMSSVLLSLLLKSSISILSLSVFLIAELCPFLLGMSLLNVLLFSFALGWHKHNEAMSLCS